MFPHEYVTLRRCEDDYWWYIGLRQLLISMIRKYAEVTPASKVLDVGCGTGGTLAFLEKNLKGAKLYSLDRHPLAISATRERGQGSLVQASANELPFPDSVFDVVISSDVFYVYEVDDLKALSESYRVLKMDGVLALNLPAFEFLRSEHDMAVHSRHRYTARELFKKLSFAGFTVRRLTYWNALLFPLVFAVRKWRPRRSVSETPRSDLKPLPPPLNEALKSLLLLERAILSRVDLPFGSSVFAVAQKLT